MSVQNRDLSRRWFEEVWNERPSDTIGELMSPDGIGHMESGDVRGVEPFRRVRDEFLAALPDLESEAEGIVSDGDDVVVRWSATGTHRGAGLGSEPSHQRNSTTRVSPTSLRSSCSAAGSRCSSNLLVTM